MADFEVISDPVADAMGAGIADTASVNVNEGPIEAANSSQAKSPDSLKPRLSGNKLLYVIGSLDVGGTERHLALLAPRLARLGWQPVVYCLARPGLQANHVAQAGVKVIPPPIAFAPKGGWLPARILKMSLSTLKLLSWRHHPARDRRSPTLLPAECLSDRCAAVAGRPRTHTRDEPAQPEPLSVKPQSSGLHRAATSSPYDRFARELAASDGGTRGRAMTVQWRGAPAERDEDDVQVVLDVRAARRSWSPSRCRPSANFGLTTTTESRSQVTAAIEFDAIPVARELDVPGDLDRRHRRSRGAALGAVGALLQRRGRRGRGRGLRPRPRARRSRPRGLRDRTDSIPRDPPARRDRGETWRRWDSNPRPPACKAGALAS